MSPHNLEGSGTPHVLVVVVNYKSDDAAATLVQDLLAQPDATGLTLAIADNSPSSSSTLANLADQHSSLCYFHFADNPYYLGAARRVLQELRSEHGGSLPFHAVALSNADITFDYCQLRAGIADAHDRTGDWRWILAPSIVESGRRYEPNPHLMSRPSSRGRRKMLDAFLPWMLYRQLYRLKRQLVTNPNRNTAPFTSIYAAYGAFIIFGSGFFSSGGVFYDAPLFGEERGIAELAAHVNVPTYFQPTIVVRHQSEVSTAAGLVGLRQRFTWQQSSDRFYDTWDPAAVQGEMSEWFKPGQLGSSS